MADLNICKYGCSSIDGCAGHCQRQAPSMKAALALLLQMAEAHVYKRVEFTDEDWKAAFDKAHDALSGDGEP